MEKLNVSFNSPQCGFMSIGFTAGEKEFHTTTAHAPHAAALPELLRILTRLLVDKQIQGSILLQWNRDPEEFDFEFRRKGEIIRLEIFQYPTEKRETREREKVFEFEGKAREICEAFYETFARLRADKDTDEFEFNWRAAFPEKEFAEFEAKLKEKRI